LQVGITRMVEESFSTKEKLTTGMNRESST
jgi:hypothetical protein